MKKQGKAGKQQQQHTEISKSEMELRRRLVDELGVLNQKMIAGDHAKRRADVIKAEIRRWTDLGGPEHSAAYEGDRFIAICSAKQVERVVNVVKAYAALGKQTFLDICRIPVDEAQRHMTFTQARECIAEERTGTRTVSCSARGSGTQDNSRAA